MSTFAEKGPGPDHILASPLWVLILRGAQFVVSIIVLGLAGRLISDAYLDEWGLAVAASVITWVIVAYSTLTEVIPALHFLYNIIAVLALDGFLVILWLATFAANAAERAKFKVTGSITSGFGGLDNLGDFDLDDIDFSDVEDQLDQIGDIGRRSISSLSKRSDIIWLYDSGMKIFAAIAGLGAVVWLLFIATFGFTLYSFLQARKQGRFQSIFPARSESSPEAGVQMESKSQPTVSVAHAPEQQQPVQYAPPAGSYPVESYPPQEQYPQGPYQQPTGEYPQQPYQASVSPPPQDPHVQGQYPPNTHYPPQQLQ
jgi:hypothetical protein